MPDILVVGSCNVDLITYTARFPQPGETLKAEKFEQCFGGKGANQAVMAAKAGASVAMLGAVGDDALGASTLANFDTVGVDRANVRTVAGAATGVAPIWVDGSGENMILIAAGANNEVTAASVEAARDVIAAAKVVVLQLEVPIEAVAAAIRIAREVGAKSVLNAAPAPTEPLPAECLEVDYFVANESEAQLVTGVPVADNDGAVAAARALQAKGAKSVALTLGARGALVLEGAADPVFVPSGTVAKVVDTSGAGDCWLGTFAARHFAQGQSPADAARAACDAAAASVQAKGTQTSYPTLPL